MPAKFSEGDTVGMTGEVSIVHDDGTVTLLLPGYDIPLTTRAEFLEPDREEEARGRPPQAALGSVELTAVLPPPSRARLLEPWGMYFSLPGASGIGASNPITEKPAPIW